MGHNIFKMELVLVLPRIAPLCTHGHPRIVTDNRGIVQHEYDITLCCGYECKSRCRTGNVGAVLDSSSGVQVCGGEHLGSEDVSTSGKEEDL